MKGRRGRTGHDADLDGFRGGWRLSTCLRFCAFSLQHVLQARRNLRSPRVSQYHGGAGPFRLLRIRRSVAPRSRQAVKRGTEELAVTKRRLKRVPKAANLTDAPQRLRKALTKRTKGELIDALVELAREDRTVLRRLDARFEWETPPQELADATRQAIADATDFDERDINRNFDYDYEAYNAVKRNLGRLVALGQLRLAMDLSLELMKQGSQQVEMSDEGLMTEDIEECFSVVVQALTKCDLPASEVIAWCERMTTSDRVGFYDRELQTLRNHFESLRSK